MVANAQTYANSGAQHTPFAARENVFSSVQSPSAAVVQISKRTKTPFWILWTATFVLVGLLSVVVLTGFGFATEAFARAVSKGAKKQNAPQSPAYPRLPADMESELNNAFYPDLAWQTTEIKDPFVDRAGFAGNKVNAVASVPVPVNMQRNTSPILNTPVMSQPVISADEKKRSAEAELLNRLEARERAIREGKTASNIASVFGYQDVLPLGLVGDKNGREVMFYSPLTRRTFLAPVGTQFFDAVFNSVKEEGVEFRTNDGRMQVIGWSKREPKQSNTQPKSETPTKVYPATKDGGNKNNAPINGYEGLQEAVKERYRKPQQPSQEKKKSSLASNKRD